MIINFIGHGFYLPGDRNIIAPIPNTVVDFYTPETELYDGGNSRTIIIENAGDALPHFAEAHARALVDRATAPVEVQERIQINVVTHFPADSIHDHMLRADINVWKDIQDNEIDLEAFEDDVRRDPAKTSKRIPGDKRYLILRLGLSFELAERLRARKIIQYGHGVYPLVEYVVMPKEGDVSLKWMLENIPRHRDDFPQWEDGGIHYRWLACREEYEQ